LNDIQNLSELPGLEAFSVSLEQIENWSDYPENCVS